MSQAQGIGNLLEVPSGILDAIGRLLAVVGLDLPAFVLQLFLLVLVGALAVPLVKQYRAAAKAAKAKKSRKALEIVVLALVAVGVVAGIVDNATTPSRVGGQLASRRLADTRVALLDYKDQVISRDSGFVDTATGRFALHYNPLVDGRARKLRIATPGCKTQEHALPRAQLRADSEATVEHECIT